MNGNRHNIHAEPTRYEEVEEEEVSSNEQYEENNVEERGDTRPSIAQHIRQCFLINLLIQKIVYLLFLYDQIPEYTKKIIHI